jgi:small subunit ribosomal protein S9
MSEEKKKAAHKKAPPKKVVKKKTVEKAAPIPEAAKPEIKEAPAPVVHEKPAPHHHAPKAKAKKPKPSNFYGTGRRKTSIARAWISPGSGKVILNDKPAEVYFCNRPVLMKAFNQPLVLTENTGKYDVVAYFNGGGIAAQADALKMAIARALVVADPNLRKLLRVNDMLKRDPREKERKKYGLKRARRAFQYTKR